MDVRTLKPGEALPAGMNTGYESMPIETNWVWVAEEDGKPVGVLMAAGCHGMVYIMRLCIPKKSRIAAFLLLRACLRDSQSRGFQGFFFHIDPTMETDRHIMLLCRKAGAKQLMVPQVLMVGSVERARRY
jgi:hypothetical protein